MMAEQNNMLHRNIDEEKDYVHSLLQHIKQEAKVSDHEARAILQQQLSQNVRLWLTSHACRDAALRHESEQDCIDHAFQRFWQAISDQGLTFTNLADALRYLKLCLHCAIMDTLRFYAHTRLEASAEQGDPDEPQIEDRHNESELWETISNLLANERERRVAYLHFHCNLEPREIMRHCPGEFSSEDEIYQIKRNILKLLSLAFS
jgi:hypothetical protein